MVRNILSGDVICRLRWGKYYTVHKRGPHQSGTGALVLARARARKALEVLGIPRDRLEGRTATEVVRRELVESLGGAAEEIAFRILDALCWRTLSKGFGEEEWNRLTGWVRSRFRVVFEGEPDVRRRWGHIKVCKHAREVPEAWKQAGDERRIRTLERMGAGPHREAWDLHEPIRFGVDKDSAWECLLKAERMAK